ncbi:hypothetical protein ACO0QE_000486 [Hanseniaspora vineae]
MCKIREGQEKETSAENTTVNNILVQRDYNFLINVNRQLSVMKNETWSRNKRMLLGQQRPEHTLVKKFKSNESSMELEFMHRRGCRCLLLPKGMKKSNINRSKWDKPLNCFVWTLEWVISGFELSDAEEVDNEELASENTIDFVSHRNKETQTLINIVARQSRVIKYVLPKPPPIQEGEEFPPRPSEQEIEKKLIALINEKNLKFYVKAFPKFISTVMDPKTLIEIDPSLPLSEILVHKTCIEFPTIYISVGKDHELKGYKVVEDPVDLEPNASKKQQNTLETRNKPVFKANTSENAPAQEISSDSDEEPMETPIVKESITQKYTPGKIETAQQSSIVPEKIEIPQTSIFPNSDSESESDQDNGVTLDFLAD